MKKYLFLSIVAVIFSACGGSVDNNIKDSASNLGTNERMLTGVTYKINSGDEIEKLSKNPQIEINSNLKTGETTAKLISGEAAIIRH